jgi:hypothetical protein
MDVEYDAVRALQGCIARLKPMMSEKVCGIFDELSDHYEGMLDAMIDGDIRGIKDGLDNQDKAEEMFRVMITEFKRANYHVKKVGKLKVRYAKTHGQARDEFEGEDLDAEIGL